MLPSEFIKILPEEKIFKEEKKEGRKERGRERRREEKGGKERRERKTYGLS